MSEIRIIAKVVSGYRKASFFMELNWVKNQCYEKLGFIPYPGTLNLKISTSDISFIKKINKNFGTKIIPDKPEEFCSAKVIPVYIADIKGGVIIPDKKVNMHDESIIEMIAPVNLRKNLLLSDNDSVILTFAYNVNELQRS